MSKRAEVPHKDMSLRLWSDETPLKPFVHQLHLAVKYLDVRGEPMARNGLLSGRVAKRHYASLAEATGIEDGDVERWLMTINAALSGSNIMDYLRIGKIEGVLWIAVFGATVTESPSISSDLMKNASDQCLKILVENYTIFDLNGNPTKTWPQDAMV